MLSGSDVAAIPEWGWEIPDAGVLGRPVEKAGGINERNETGESGRVESWGRIGCLTSRIAAVSGDPLFVGFARFAVLLMPVGYCRKDVQA